MPTKSCLHRGRLYEAAITGVAASWATHDDERELREKRWDVQPGDVVLDVGAAYGSYALAALASGASMVYAWAPEDEQRDCLWESVLLNGWQDRCRLLSDAAYRAEGWLDLLSGEFAPLGQRCPEGSAHARALDSYRFVQDIPRGAKAWLKMDVEGAEVDVLLGARELLARAKPRVFVENHFQIRPTVMADIRGILAPLGYSESWTGTYYTGAISHSLWE